MRAVPVDLVPPLFLSWPAARAVEGFCFEVATTLHCVFPATLFSSPPSRRGPCPHARFLICQ